MLNIYADKFNFGNPIKGKLPLIIDAFVKFYGEEHRSEITQKINDTIFLFLPSGDSNEVLLQLDIYFKKLQNNLKEQMFSRLNKPFDKFLLNDFIPTDLDNIINALKEKNLTKEQTQYINKIKKIFNIKNKLFDNNTEVLEILENLNTEYKTTFKQKFSRLNIDKFNAMPYFSSYKKDLELDKAFEKNQKDAVISYFAKVKNVSVEEILKTKNIETYVMVYLSLINDTNSESQDFDYMKAMYIDLYKFLGFNHGNSFKSYLVDPDLNQIIYNKELISKLEVLKNDYAVDKDFNFSLNEFMTDAYQSIYNLNISLYEKRLLLKSVYDYMTKKSFSTAYVTHCFDEKTKSCKSLCVLPIGYLLENSTLFHELNHIVSSSLQKNHEDYFVLKSGIRQMVLSKKDSYLITQNPLFKETVDSRITSMNEVFNDKLSLDILDIFNKEGNQITDLKNTKSNYAYAFGLLDDYIKNNYQIIKKYFISNQVKPLDETFYNYNEIADLTDEFLNRVIYSNEFKSAMKEISLKKLMFKDVEYYCKDYLDEKWSNETNKILDYYRTAKKLATTEKTSNKNNEQGFEM